MIIYCFLYLGVANSIFKITSMSFAPIRTRFRSFGRLRGISKQYIIKFFKSNIDLLWIVTKFLLQFTIYEKICLNFYKILFFIPWRNVTSWKNFSKLLTFLEELYKIKTIKGKKRKKRGNSNDKKAWNHWGCIYIYIYISWFLRI